MDFKKACVVGTEHIMERVVEDTVRELRGLSTWRTRSSMCRSAYTIVRIWFLL